MQAMVQRVLETHGMDRAIDLIFETVNDMCHAGKFCEIDSILKSMDVSKIPTTLLISWLTITAAAKHKLAERESFFSRACDELNCREGPHKSTRLVSGLE